MSNDQYISKVDGDALKHAFGRVVYNRRLAMGMEQRPFSRMSGIGNTYLRRIEEGDANVSIITVAKLASAFGVEPSVLLDETTRLMGQNRRNPRR